MKNKFNSPVNKICSEIKLQVQNLIKTKYYDFNILHLKEVLFELENISIKRETLRKWCHEIHNVKRAKRRRPKIRKRRERMSSPGMMIQFDGSTHQWFGDKKTCLIAAIDDSDSSLYAEFHHSESTIACLKVLKNIIFSRGIFKTLYVDRAGLYGGPKRVYFSQVQRALEELGIEIIYANSAQAKGRIERTFDTLQDRLIPELRINKINTIKGANNYLHKKFIPNYWNKKILINSKSMDSYYRPIPPYFDLNKIFIQKEYRKIRNDHTFSFDNEFYLIESKMKYSIAKQEIEIHLLNENQFEAFFAGKKLMIRKVISPKKRGVFEEEIQKKIDVINLAKKLNNIAEASRISGVSRQTIHKNMRLLKEKGPTALKRAYNPNHRHKNRISIETEKRILEYSILNPHLGQKQISLHLKVKFNLEISPGGVRNIWLRNNMETMVKRMEKNDNKKVA